MAPTPAFLVQLPPDLRLQVMDCLPQSDVGTLLQLSKEVGRQIAPIVHKLEPPQIQLPDSYKPDALLRLVRKLSGLRELSVDLQDPTLHQTVGLMLVEAMQDGFVGSQLRVLCLGGCSAEVLRGLFDKVLLAGLLPSLTELELPGLCEWEPEAEADKEVGRCDPPPPPSSQLEFQTHLAMALEARRTLGLPPLTRLEGIGGFDASVLGRIWACCPIDKLAYAEADGEARLAALEQHLRGSSMFPALKAIDLGGGEPPGDEEDDSIYGDEEEEEDDDDDDDDDEEEEDDDDAENGGENGGAPLALAQILDALARGRTPKLEEVSIGGWDPEMGAVGAPLGRAIREGQFPALTSLAFEEMELPEGDFLALVEGLRSHGGVLRFSVAWVNVSEEEVALLADVMREEKGGLARLEEMELVGSYLPWDPVVRALGDGAPCASTLTGLALSEGAVSADCFQSVLGLLALGGLPALRRLEVDGDDQEVSDKAVMLGVPQALLASAKEGRPSRLQELGLSAATGWGGCVHELGRVFRVNGLPRLAVLDIRMDSTGAKRGSPGLFDEWKRLGPSVRLEWISLDGVSMARDARRRFLELLSDPAFCPSLRHVRCGAGLDDDIDQALETRREMRDRAARV